MFSHIITSPERLEEVVQLQPLVCGGEAGLFDLIVKCFCQNQWNDNEMQKKAMRIFSHIQTNRMSEEDLKYVTDECERLAKESEPHISVSWLAELELDCYKRIVRKNIVPFYRLFLDPHKNRLPCARSKLVFTFKSNVSGDSKRTSQFSDDEKDISFCVEIGRTNYGDLELELVIYCGQGKCEQRPFHSCQMFLISNTGKFIFFSEGSSALKLKPGQWNPHGHYRSYTKITAGATVFY